MSLASNGPPGTECIIRKMMIDTTMKVKATERMRRMIWANIAVSSGCHDRLDPVARGDGDKLRVGIRRRSCLMGGVARCLRLDLVGREKVAQALFARIGRRN